MSRAPFQTNADWSSDPDATNVCPKAASRSPIMHWLPSITKKVQLKVGRVAWSCKVQKTKPTVEPLPGVHPAEQVAVLVAVDRLRRPVDVGAVVLSVGRVRERVGIPQVREGGCAKVEEELVTFKASADVFVSL